MEKLYHSGPAGVAPKIMSLESIKEITNNFSEERKLGSGTFGEVYKGVQNGKEVAVKMLHLMPGHDDLEQFKREFENLWRLKHQNVVQLLGYCYEIRLEYVELGDGKTVFAQNIYRALCFEYMQNGSLQKHLSDEYHGLDWQTRYNIIKGACEGLKYLHEGLGTPIYHLDLKPDNILLDKNMVPKLADFGLSKLVCNDQTQFTRRSIGTIGYLPPEYIEKNLVSKKLDIFSLGVVMIQIITGQNGYHRSAEMSSQEFIDLVQENWRNRLEAAPRCTSLEAECHQVKRSIEIALDCVQVDRKKRPNIGDIIHWLNETEQMIEKMAHSSVSKLVDEVQSMAVSAVPSPLQQIISVPKGPEETNNTEIHSHGSFETSKLLDVHPLELRFPWEPNNRIRCPVTLTNRTDHYVGVKITPICQDTCSDLHFLVLWEGKRREVPYSPLFQLVEPHSTLVLTMTMEEKQLPPPPREIGKYEVLMLEIGSEEVLRDLKLKMHRYFLKKVEEIRGEVHRAMLRAVICDPSSCAAVITHQLVPGVSGKEYSPCIDTHTIVPWILVGDSKGLVSIWNYRTQKRLMALKVTRVHTRGVYRVCSVIFITGEQWFAAGDYDGWVHVYNHTMKEKVKEFEAHRSVYVNSLVVHPTHPFLLTSSPNDPLIKLWDWSQEWTCIRTFDVPNKSVIHLMLNPRDTDTFSSVSLDRTIKVWNIHSSCPMSSMVESYSAGYISIDSHRHLMATTFYRLFTSEGSDSIWDLQTEKRVHKLGVRGNTSHLVCHPTLPILATVLDFRAVCLWDARTYSGRLEKMVKLRDSPNGMVFTSTKDIIRLILNCTGGIYVMEINLPTVTTDIYTGGWN
ncbi:hypothetical protein ACP70R_021510 [Stipagrostis hirtigluma subsp. patula]